MLYPSTNRLLCLMGPLAHPVSDYHCRERLIGCARFAAVFFLPASFPPALTRGHENRVFLKDILSSSLDTRILHIIPSLTTKIPVVLKSADAAGSNVGLSTIAISRNWIVQTPDYILETDFTPFFFTLISRLWPECVNWMGRLREESIACVIAWNRRDSGDMWDLQEEKLNWKVCHQYLCICCSLPW